MALAMLLVSVAARAQEFPAHVGKVNDFANVLSAAQRDQLESDLAGLEHDTSAEVAVVTVPSLGARSIEEYATGLFNAWGIGKQDRDNGVLILVSPNDRAMRLEVGYGLEPVLPDGLAGAIIRETFLPRFRAGDMPTGIVEGTARVVGVVRRNEVVTPEQLAAYAAAAHEAGTSWGMAALFSIFIAIGAFAAGTGLGAKVVVQSLFGLFFMGAGLFAAFWEAPRASHLLLLAFAAALIGWGIMLGRRPKWRRSIRGTGAGGSRSGWTMGSSGGSSSGGSSGSSSSGSFGGGSSGGGGASGRW